MAPLLKHLAFCLSAVVLACADEHRTPDPAILASLPTEVDGQMIDGGRVQSEESVTSPSCSSELLISIGALQRADPRHQDLYVFGRCEPVNGLGLDVIWVPASDDHRALTSDELIAMHRNSKCLSKTTNLTRSGFKAAVFELPLQEVKDPLLDDPYKFPCLVAAYVTDGEDLKFLSKTRVGSWESYVELQASVIHR